VIDTNANGSTDDEKAALSTGLAGNNIPHSFDGDVLNVPLVADSLFGRNSDDLDSTVFGGEASYLYVPNNSRFGFEVGAGATFYNDAKSRNVYTGAVGDYTGGTALSEFDTTGPAPGGTTCANVGTCAGDPSFYSQSGFMNFDRDYDIDLVGRVHFFMNDRLALNVGGGLSWAHASVSGASTVDGSYAGLNTAFKDDVDSFGYVLTAGATYWATDQVTIGIGYDYKAHDFDVRSSGSDSLDLGGPFGPVGSARLVGGVSDRSSIEDEVHTIKARVGIKLN